MEKPDLEILQSNIDKHVQITTVDGEQMIAKLISVFAEESDPDIFFELVSSSHPHLYAQKDNLGGYSLPLADIFSVRSISDD